MARPSGAMSIIFGYVPGLLTGFALWIVINWGWNNQSKQKPVETEPVTESFRIHMINDLVVGYDGPNGKPFELVYNAKSQQVVLRTNASIVDFIGDDSVERLKTEVVRLISTESPVALGDSGISFRFVKGQYPIWGPHQEMVPGYNYHCLFFAEKALVKEGVIEAEGLPVRPDYFYPYPEF